MFVLSVKISKIFILKYSQNIDINKKHNNSTKGNQNIKKAINKSHKIIFSEINN